MYQARENRYEKARFRRAGDSGLQLPLISFGLWQNFGHPASYDSARDMLLHAFDLGITQFDLANNYGPPPGSAETLFGQILKRDLSPWRDELIITTKAGYDMWPGPYGVGGSRKYLLTSLEQSLKRLRVDYVDIFYSHRFDPDTPLAETLGALKTAVDQGKALYAGISSYSATRTKQALAIARDMALPLTVHQPSYSMLNRWIEQPDDSGESLLEVLEDAGMGTVVFSPLAQGMLTNRYLGDVPVDSRAVKGTSLKREYLSESNLKRIRSLNEIAADRGQSLAQMAVAWVLRDPRVTTALVGASSVKQLQDTLGALDTLEFSDDELRRIDEFALDGSINLWASRSSDL